MAAVIRPTWAQLDELIASADERLLILSPYYSEEGVTHVIDHIGPTVHLAMRTKLSASDWANGVTDPMALFAILDLLAGRHDLLIVPRLHAKAYFADRQAGIIGSANLSHGGFSTQVELVVEFEGAEAEVAIAVAEASCGGGKGMSLDELSGWIARNAARIDEARARSRDAEEMLAPVQRDLDETLGYGGGGHSLADPGLPRLDEFVAWLREHDGLPGADAILQRHDHHQNLQGHVKQSLFALLRFFEEHPELVGPLSAALDQTRDGIYSPTPEVLGPWATHLDDHATDSGDGWSYSTLRTQTPESLGGTVTGGGGNSGTLKRMFPLVARYLAGR